ncbi:uncharacterized protein LAESUDRAFT_292572 [Laetiporus sulphureus 93-53]|uniref:Homeobox domain-containing protein n=1 Tax=Laetiporus sulphureus 93-53 TaxID=1314785 RepID=A0A165DAB4_9APHY|nr:uncharacterized protein LAESUDRAFT_292572 [Laetiporus sulphureus 93-53]KZT04429.1 hypothetical protein LAESUDRAFT_292572 [Laetiporus sulphureus 93-53]
MLEPFYAHADGESASSYTASSSSMASTSARRLHKRLSHQGYQMIDELWKVTQNPTAIQRQELLQKINALPGCDHYTNSALQTLFSRRRKDAAARAARYGSLPQKIEGSGTVSSSEDILYPSFKNSPGVIPSLQVLLNEFPLPNDEMVRIWAKRLRVHYEDVQTWIQFERASAPVRERSSSVNESARTQLPTPGSSCSPEPSTLWQLPAHIPVPEAHRAHASLFLEDQDIEEEQKPNFLTLEQRQELAQDVRAALSAPQPPPPKTADEAKKWLDEQEQNMSTFLQKIRLGDYAQFGLEPSLLPKCSEHDTILTRSDGDMKMDLA